MAAVKMLAKGQVVIPAGLRRKYHMKPGTEIQILEYGGTLYLVPPWRIQSRLLADSFPRGRRSPGNCSRNVVRHFRTQRPET